MTSHSLFRKAVVACVFTLVLGIAFLAVGVPKAAGNGETPFKITGIVTNGTAGLPGTVVSLLDATTKGVFDSVYAGGNGDFTFNNLENGGQYKILAVRDPADTNEYPAGDYATEWYNDADTFSTATVVTPSIIPTPLVITLEKPTSISGEVIEEGSGKEPVGGCWIDIYDPVDMIWITSFKTDGLGDYEAKGMRQNARYRINFNPRDNVHLNEWYNNAPSWGLATEVRSPATGIDAELALLNPKKSPPCYLAEGSTDWGFETYITIENPNSSAATAKITYMTKTGPKTRKDVKLPLMSQTVINPRGDLGATDFSTKVECKEGKRIAVDRRMIWAGTGAPCSEGHAAVAVNAPNKVWYLPEGSSDWGFECWLLIQNPNTSEATCKVTYMIEDEKPRNIEKKIPANSRKSFNMADDIGMKDASIKVEANVPVIPERAMYKNNRREGHDSTGTTTPAKTYYLAEGTTREPFTTYVLIQNPNSSAAQVTLTYMTSEGPKAMTPFSMDANSRKTIKVNEQVPSKDLSTMVTADKPIIAERAMYWTEEGLGEACHDSIGMSEPHNAFYLPDGEVNVNTGFETFTLVQNPNATDITVEISYMTPTGKGNKVFTDTLKGNSRKTYKMSDKIKNGRAAVMVRSKTANSKIMVERAMYWNNKGAGTDTIGGYADWETETK